MGPDLFLQPAVILSAADRIPFHLGSIFDMLTGKVMIIFFIIILTQGNSTALTVYDLTVLNDPSICPVRTDHAILIGGRRSPRRCCLFHIKSRQRNKIDVLFLRHKALSADVNLNLFFPRILPLEVRIDHRFFPVLNGIPFVHRPFLIPRRLINLTLFTLFQCQSLI